MQKTLITLAIFFAMAGAAHADPIFTPIFTAIFSTAFGLTGGALTSFVTIASARVTRLIMRRCRK